MSHAHDYAWPPFGAPPFAREPVSPIVGWTDERIALLKKLWGEGLSASQVAKQLRHVTRSAVIGKVHRLNLAKRQPKNNRPPARIRTRAERPTGIPRSIGKPTPPAPLSDDMAAIKAITPLDPSLSVLRLSAFTCRFPIGDPSSADFAFCGRTTRNDESVYCPAHMRLCYVKPTKQRVNGTARLAAWLDSHGKRAAL